MSADLSKAYELLGVKPGVSIRELKAAHRDLAKVWHPDRFLHDPRLQEKAQEKLKEINEAYELISSGKIPRATPPPRTAHTVNDNSRADTTARRGGSWQWVTLALLVFAAVFVITTQTLLKKRPLPLAEETVQAEESSNVAQPTQPDSNTRAEIRSGAQKPDSENPAPEATSTDTVTTEPTPAVATVTVTIDPETGLLAKPECKLRSRMSYPSDSQPTAYCTLSHLPPPKDSKIKSIAKSVKRTLD